MLEARAGSLAWRYEGEAHLARSLTPGTPDGGFATGPPSVVICVEVRDVAAALDQIEQAGGTVVTPAHEIPRFTWVGAFADPAGNVIALQQQLGAR